MSVEAKVTMQMDTRHAPWKQEGETFLNWAARLQISGCAGVGMRSKDFAHLLDDMRAVMAGPPSSSLAGRSMVFLNGMPITDSGESSWIAWND